MRSLTCPYEWAQGRKASDLSSGDGKSDGSEPRLGTQGFSGSGSAEAARIVSGKVAAHSVARGGHGGRAGHARRETGGGAIQDALTHMVNAAEWLVGPVTKLVADAEHCLLDGTSVEDTANLLTRHDRVIGSFSLNQHQAPNETLLTIVCERGTIRYEGHRNRWLSCSEPGADWTVEEEFSLERDDLFIRQANAFLDQLDGTAPAACPLADGMQTLRVNLAALKSADSGIWIEP